MPIPIEGTFEELSGKVRDLMEPYYSEGAFREAMASAPAVPDARYSVAHRFVSDKVDPVPPGVLEPVGRGTTQSVYMAPRDPETVVKVAVLNLDRSIKWGLLFGRDGNTPVPEHVWQLGHALAQSENERYQRLASYFPPGAAPEQSVTVEQVPVRGKVLDYMMRTDLRSESQRALPHVDQDAIFHVPALVRSQRFLPQMGDKATKHFSLGLRFPERFANRPSPDIYERINQTFLIELDSPLDEAAFRYCISGTKLEALYEAAQTDDEQRELVLDFLARAIRYMNEEREILDVGGDGNAIFNKKYFLPDVLSGHRIRRALDTAVQALERIDDGEDVAPLAGWSLQFSLVYSRAMNAVAKALGSDARVELFPNGSRRGPKSWNRVLDRIYMPPGHHRTGAATGPRTQREPVFIPVPHGPWGEPK